MSTSVEDTAGERPCSDQINPFAAQSFGREQWGRSSADGRMHRSDMLHRERQHPGYFRYLCQRDRMRRSTLRNEAMMFWCRAIHIAAITDDRGAVVMIRRPGATAVHRADAEDRGTAHGATHPLQPGHGRAQQEQNCPYQGQSAGTEALHQRCEIRPCRREWKAICAKSCEAEGACACTVRADPPPTRRLLRSLYAPRTHRVPLFHRECRNVKPHQGNAPDASHVTTMHAVSPRPERRHSPE